MSQLNSSFGLVARSSGDARGKPVGHRSEPGMSPATWLLRGLVAAAFCYLALFVLRADIRNLINIVPDDAFYYLNIAENLAAHRGLTFDGTTPTNGFQPLWLYVLTGLFSVCDSSPETMFRLCLVLQIAMLACASCMLLALGPPGRPSSFTWATAVIFVSLVVERAANGMESALLVLTLTALLRYGSRTQVLKEFAFRRSLVFGLLLGLVMLSRLDTVFVGAAALGFALLTAIRRPESRGRALVGSGGMALGATAVVSPYLVFNQLEFGRVMPISGVLKSSFPVPSISFDAILGLGHPMAAVVLACASISLCYVAWFAWKGRLMRRPHAHPHDAAMAILAAGVVLHFCYVLVFMRWAVFYWHFVPSMLFVSLAAGSHALHVRLWSRRPRVRNTFYWAAIVVAIGLGAANAHRRRSLPLDHGWHAAAYEAALWAQRETTNEDLFAMKDAGTFGFFSERDVVNLDGLVNGPGFQEVLRDKQLTPYLRSLGVRYLAQPISTLRGVPEGRYHSFSFRYHSHQYGVESDGIVLRKSSEVYRSPPFSLSGRTAAFIIWRLTE